MISISMIVTSILNQRILKLFNFKNKNNHESTIKNIREGLGFYLIKIMRKSKKIISAMRHDEERVEMIFKLFLKTLVVIVVVFGLIFIFFKYA